MSTFLESAWRHSSIPAELASVRPLGDFVLVRVLPEEEMHRNLIWLPQFSGPHADRQMRPVLPSIGEVVATGPGDKLPNIMILGACGHDWFKWEPMLPEDLVCPECGESDEPISDAIYKGDRRAPMHVSPGDRIMYWRVPANEVIINEDTFQFLHEEQHILGVIE